MRRVMNSVLLALGVLVLAGGIGSRLLDLRMQTVLSGSMVPTVSPGDVVVTQPVPLADLRVGDVIAFYPPGKPTPVLHRIATLEVVDGDVVVTTKGDANGVPDPWTATLKAEPAFRMVGYLPLIGWLPQFRGLLFVVAGLLVGLALVRGLWKETWRHRPSPA